jgi:hypothetical protein
MILMIWRLLWGKKGLEFWGFWKGDLEDKIGGWFGGGVALKVELKGGNAHFKVGIRVHET